MREAVDESGATTATRHGQGHGRAHAQGARPRRWQAGLGAGQRRAGDARVAPRPHMLARSASIRSFTRRDGVRLVVHRPADDRRPRRDPRRRHAARIVRRVERHRRMTSPRSTSARRARSRTPAPWPPSSAARRCASRFRRSTTTRPSARETITDQQLAAFDATVGPVDAAYTAVLDDLSRQTALRAAIPHLTTSAQNTLAGLNQVQWTALRGEMTRVLESTERQEVKDTLLPEVRGSLANRVNDRFRPRPARARRRDPVAARSLPTRTFDATATERAREDAANGVDADPVLGAQGRGSRARAARSIDDAAREKLTGLRSARSAARPRAGRWLAAPGDARRRAAARLDLALPAADLAPHAGPAAHRASC